MFQNNYINLWKETKKDMLNWTKLHLSFYGRIAVLKMNVLPRLLYLFQNLPVIAERKYFLIWQKEFSRFLWEGKRARIRWKLLTDDVLRGGCALPNLELYYYAACLFWIENRLRLENERLMTLECGDLRFGIHAYLWYEKVKEHQGFKHHYVRKALFYVWNKIKELFYSSLPQWVSTQEALCRRTKDYRSIWLIYKDLIFLEMIG